MTPSAWETYESAAGSFVGLVRAIPPDRWDGPGLGEWDLRSLVGHTSRAVTTVRDYLPTSAEREDIATPQEYYARVKRASARIDPAAVAERGRQAGIALGPDPATAVQRIVDEVVTQLAGAEDRVIAVIGGSGIRLSTYLPTRTFELAVHSLDIAAAVGVPFELPQPVRGEVTVLAARIAAALGDGPAVLAALTGRGTLPEGFSVV